MPRWLNRRAAERGSGPVTALMVMAILALVFTIGISAIFAAASDERSSAMHAADAAALAGARGVLDGAPADTAPGFLIPEVDIPQQLGGSPCSPKGQVKAFQLAQLNGATLTRYCYNSFTDTVRVAVRMNDHRVGNGPATASAEAVTTFQAASCRVDPDNDPTQDDKEDPPEETPPPEDDEEPEPPPIPADVETSLECGPYTLTIIFRYPENKFFFVNLAAELDDRDPRLTK